MPRKTGTKTTTKMNLTALKRRGQESGSLSLRWQMEGSRPHHLNGYKNKVGTVSKNLIELYYDVHKNGQMIVLKKTHLIIVIAILCLFLVEHYRWFVYRRFIVQPWLRVLAHYFSVFYLALVLIKCKINSSIRLEISSTNLCTINRHYFSFSTLFLLISRYESKQLT